ncbi:MAG: hypothetical protein JSR45_14310 [Proteobacteria bacterium]|nr:hypothetical protein [Pseudomonadota bacterium]
MSLRLIAVVAVAALALGACGKRGTLERPPPMFGDKAKAEYEAQQHKDVDNEQRSGPSKYDPNNPPAPESQNTSPRTNPLDGPSRGPSTAPNSPNEWLQQNQPHGR